MKFTWSTESKDPPFGFIFGIVSAAASLMLYISYPLLPSYATHCTFHRVTGIPCPTCGATRSGLALFHGHILQAITFNPLLFTAGLFLALWGFFSLFFEVIPKRRLVISLTQNEKRGLRIGIILLILVNWAYLIAVGI